MSTNCLVTKLKGAVNNDNLDFFGKFVIELTNTNPITLAGTSGKVKVLNGEVYRDSSATGETYTEYDLSEELDYVTPTVRGVVLVVDKYNITKFANTIDELTFNPCTVKSSLLDYSDSLRSFKLIGGASVDKSNVEELTSKIALTTFLYRCSEVDIANILLTKLKKLDIRAKGDITGKSFPIVTTMIFGEASPHLTGDISTISAPKLTTLDLYNTAITGDFKTFCDNLWNNGSGKTSGTIVIRVDISSTVTWGASTILTISGGTGSATVTFSQNSAPSIA